jgi:hypothetical protein
MSTTEDVLSKIAEVMERQNEVLKGLQGKDGEDHQKVAANTHTAVRLHGDTGIFTGPGLERDVISTHVRPYGIGSLLPIFPSTSEDPRFGALTGFSDDIGAEPANACDDAPTGYLKGCNLTARFGMIRRDTETIEMDKVMLKVNRGDFTDLILRGTILGLTDLEPSGMDQSQILNVITMAEMISVAVRTERKLVKQIWQGTRAVANEFPGLDVQIATGIQDADTGTPCPSLDSDVKDFNYQEVCDGSSIVTYLSSMEWFLKNLAYTTGVDPVNWVIAMRPELWFELTSCWPCAYHTDRCTTGLNVPGSSVTIDGRDNTRERDAMRNGMYIHINGSRYNVVTDVGIFEKNNINDANLQAGEYASSIYMLPLNITGNFPVLYREYVDYKQAAPDINLLRGLEQFFWTDNGVYSWAIEQVKWCYKLALKTEQRIILRTPHLAGRIDNVKYAPLQHLRDADPQSPYWKDGGLRSRTAISAPYAVWEPYLN